MLHKKTSQPKFQKWPGTILAGLVSILLTVIGLTGSAAPAQASGGMPSAIFDLNSVAWASIRNYTSAAFSDYFDTKTDQGYMLIDYEITEINGEQRVSGVFQKNVDGRGWVAFRNLTSDEFSQKWNQYKEAGYRPIEQDGYVLDGQLFFSLIMIENKEGLAWASRRNLTSEQFSTEFDQYKDDYIPVDIEAYPAGGSLRYAVIWVENVENLAWIERRDLTSDQFGDYFQQYKSDYRVHDVEAYIRGGNQNYAAIWIENKNGRAWKELRDMTVEQYAAAWQANWDAGYRVTDFEVYDTPGGQKRYAAVWRQNSIRPQWPHKNAVDTLLEQAMDDFDIPGMSVAVVKGNTFLYLRGLGYADIDDGQKASSKTVYRLASVSKAVAGVLALDLQEQGQIDLSEDTRTYVPPMPVHHTHQVWQTIANRAGIGHYSDYDNISPTMYGQYNTAIAAAPLFWDEPLLTAPGTDYEYSTPAYTLLGTAIEGATGYPIATVIEDELTTPYNLPTLVAEDRNQPNPQRSAVYLWQSNQNVEWASPDNLSWKVLGGGLEASAYDMARFGIKLLGGDILNNASRNTLWTPPDGLSNFAYGWNTGTDQCSTVVAKNGGQWGANSYIRMYPDLDITIVVLTNRWQGGHSAVQIGRDIGTILLNTECAAPQPVAFRGFEHLALGQARLAIEDDQLTIANLDFHGDDGLSIKLDRVQSWQADMRFEFDEKAEATFSAKVDEQIVSALRLEEKGNALSIVPNFHAQSYKIVYMNGDEMVGETTQSTGTSAALFNWDEINCLLNGGLSFICRLKVEYWNQADGGSTWSLFLPQPVLVDPPGGGRALLVDGIKLMEVPDNQLQSASAPLLTSMQINFAHVNSAVIEDETTTVGGVEATNSVYLPIVVR